jgi:hypothetical protein
MDLQQSVQSVPITTKVVNSNPIHGEAYPIQHYVINFVSDLGQVGGFLRVLRFPPLQKLTATINWNIVENGVKRHKTNQSPLTFDMFIKKLVIIAARDNICTSGK